MAKFFLTKILVFYSKKDLIIDYIFVDIGMVIHTATKIKISFKVIERLKIYNSSNIFLKEAKGNQVFQI